MNNADTMCEFWHSDLPYIFWLHVSNVSYVSYVTKENYSTKNQKLITESAC